MLSLRHRAVAAMLAALMVAGAGLALAEPAGAVGYSIAGTVTMPSDAPHEWLADVIVDVETLDGEWVTSKRVNATTGAYQIALDEPGEYVVRFRPLNGMNCLGCSDPMNLIPETWPDAWDPVEGVALDVQGPVTGIDADLEYGGILSGRVSIADERFPSNAAAYSLVEAWELATGIHASVQASITGDYVLSGLVPGYHVVCVDTGGASRWYSDPAVWAVSQCWDHELKAVHAEPIDTTEYDWEGVDFDLVTTPHMDDVVDLAGHPSYTPFAEEIVWLLASGISTGFTDPWDPSIKYFAPRWNVTREQMAAFLYRYAGEPAYTAPKASPFVDLKTSATFYKEICWLYAEGISKGWTTASGREYRPKASITREQMAAFLYRFAGVEGWTPPATSPFSDVSTRATFYRQIGWLAEAGISRGWTIGSTVQFRPTATVTREQMAAFLYRLDDLG